MKAALPLSKMTVAEKLRALEQIWEDLSRKPRNVPSPAWHEDVLRARECRVREGKAKYGDWEVAKKRIRERTK